MHDAVPVRVVQRVCHGSGDAHRLVHGELMLAVDPVPERLALDVRHHVEQEAVRLAGVEEREDVGVLQVGRRLDLGDEPLAADHCRELGLEDLERHAALVSDVLGQVDRGHAALTDLALDPVSTFQGCVQASGGIGHACLMGEGPGLKDRASPSGTHDSRRSGERGEIADLLQDCTAGETEAIDNLIPLVYDDLPAIAHGRLAFERPDHSSTPAASVTAPRGRAIPRRPTPLRATPLRRRRHGLRRDGRSRTSALSGHR